ncbi:MAG: hypothetical protein WD381_07920 [Balneolaceae bacterium]
MGVFSVLFLMIPALAHSQANPKRAFVRSAILPGWGHYYINKFDWTRGQYHLGADIILIMGYFGLNARASNLDNQFISLANLRADASIANRDRSYRLAIGQFNSLDEYNDFQLRSRNWNQLYDDTPENRWSWNSDEDRRQYRDLREDADQIRTQLPAIIGLLALNRVISGVSAFTRARNNLDVPQVSVLPAHSDLKITGAVANLKVTF